MIDGTLKLVGGVLIAFGVVFCFTTAMLAVWFGVCGTGAFWWWVFSPGSLGVAFVKSCAL